MYQKDRYAKRGKWSSPRTILSIDEHSCSVKLGGNSGKPIHAVVEYVWIAVTEDELAVHIAETNDQVNAYMED